MRDVAVIGVGMTQFGELWERSFRDIGLEAGMSAMVDAGIGSDDIDALYVGNMSAGMFIEQEHVGALIADYVGLSDSHIPSVRVEAGGASGALALRQGYLSVASGVNDIVVVGGAEKMTDVADTAAEDILSKSADQEWEVFFGATLTSLYAMMARRHMHEFGTTAEQLAQVSVLNHTHGSMNPKAHFRNRVKLEHVLGSPIAASPLRTLECAPVSDGGAAVILASMDKAEEFKGDRPLVKISGSAQASDTISLHARSEFTSLTSTREAARKAYKRAGLTAKDIDVAEINDNFTIAALMALEALGFAEKGKSGPWIEEGNGALDGSLPINPSGGLKARGQPPGAVGIAQAAEIVSQLRGECGDRNVKDPRVGLTHNLGGTGATSIVHIFEVV